MSEASQNKLRISIDRNKYSFLTYSMLSASTLAVRRVHLSIPTTGACRSKTGQRRYSLPRSYIPCSSLRNWKCKGHEQNSSTALSQWLKLLEASGRIVEPRRGRYLPKGPSRSNAIKLSSGMRRTHTFHAEDDPRSIMPGSTAPSRYSKISALCNPAHTAKQIKQCTT